MFTVLPHECMSVYHNLCSLYWGDRPQITRELCTVNTNNYPNCIQLHIGDRQSFLQVLVIWILVKSLKVHIRRNLFWRSWNVLIHVYIFRPKQSLAYALLKVGGWQIIAGIPLCFILFLLMALQPQIMGYVQLLVLH